MVFGASTTTRSAQTVVRPTSSSVPPSLPRAARRRAMRRTTPRRSRAETRRSEPMETPAPKFSLLGLAAALAAGLSVCVAILAGESEPKPGNDEKEKKAQTVKPATLEDFYGDTGKRFQAALSFYNREPLASTITPSVSGYG